MSTFQTTIDKKRYNVATELQDCELTHYASTVAPFSAICRETGSIYLQFTNGTVYKHIGVPADVLQSAKEAPSIGKFMHSTLKAYQFEVLPDRHMIVPVPEDDPISFDDIDDDPNYYESHAE
jgi:hypothetical protein